MLAFASNITSIDIPLLLSLVSVYVLLLSHLYVSFYFLSQLEVFYAAFQLGLTSLETDGSLFPVFVLYGVDILEYN